MVKDRDLVELFINSSELPDLVVLMQGARLNISFY